MRLALLFTLPPTRFTRWRFMFSLSIMTCAWTAAHTRSMFERPSACKRMSLMAKRIEPNWLHHRASLSPGGAHIVANSIAARQAIVTECLLSDSHHGDGHYVVSMGALACLVREISHEMCSRWSSARPCALLRRRCGAVQDRSLKRAHPLLAITEHWAQHAQR